MTNKTKFVSELKGLWAKDPRAAFVRAIPEGSRLAPQQGRRALLEAGLMPIKTTPNGLSESCEFAPHENARWSFWLQDHGWLDAWSLYITLGHEDYLVIALVGLGIPLDRIANALAMISSPEAWSGLGAVGWIHAFSRHTSAEKGSRNLAEIIPLLGAIEDQAAIKVG